jgi:transposase
MVNHKGQSRPPGRPKGRKKQRPRPIKAVHGKGFLLPQAVGCLKGLAEVDIDGEKLSIRDIAAMMNCHHSTVQAHLKRELGTTGHRNLPRKPHPLAKNKAKRLKKIDQLMKKEKGERCVRGLQVDLELAGFSVSIAQIYRDLDELGWQWKRRPRCPNMRNPENMKKRLEFAENTLAWMNRRNDPLKWDDLVFSDESYFAAGDFQKGQWCKGDEQPEPIVKERWAPKCHVFGLLHATGYRLVRLPSTGSGKGGGVNSQDFTKTLSKELPDLRRITEAKHLILDGASIHTSAHTEEWFRGKDFLVFDDWPPHSPDLNPIENLWAIIKREIGSTLADTLENNEENREIVFDAVKDAAREVDPIVFHNLVKSFRTRLEKCVEVKGDWTGY